MKLSLYVVGISSVLTNVAQAAVVAPVVASVQTNATGKSITVNWVDNNTSRVNFKIERSQDNTSSFSEIGIRGKDARSIEDFRVAAKVTYYYRIRSLDTQSGYLSGYSNIMAGSLGGVVPAPKPTPTISPNPNPPVPPIPEPPTPPAPPKACLDYPHSRRVDVATAAKLQVALNTAQEGDLILLADGVYAGNFATNNVKADSTKPITICGSQNAILDGSNVSKGYVLHVESVNYWNIVGISVREGQKGIILDDSNHCVLDSLTVFNIGDEAVHFRKNSAYNTIQNTWIHDTGLHSQAYGEGIYLGSSKNNLVGDKSDYSRILNNHIGPNIAAEPIDIKEYTTGGLIEGNIIDGTGQSGKNSATSLINVKGNSYIIRGNQGSKPLVNGFTVHVLVQGGPSGNNNLFEKNILDLQAPGRGFDITGGGTGNVVKCNNVVKNAGDGLSNIPCTP